MPNPKKFTSREDFLAGLLRAQRPRRTGQKAARLSQELENQKLEGDPLTLNGTQTDGIVGAKPQDPGKVGNGERLILYSSLENNYKNAIGMDSSNRMWFLSHRGAFDFYLSAASGLGTPGARIMRSAGAGGTMLRVGSAANDPHSTLHSEFSFATGIATTSTSLTLTAAHCVVICNTSGGAITITLPAAADCTGRWYHIKRNGGSAVTVDANGAELIDASATQRLDSDKAAISIISDGTQWWLISHRGTIT